MTAWGRSATTAPVAAVVREAFGADARVTRSRRVGGVRDRSALLRLHLDGGDLPATVVAKRLKSASAGDPDALGLFHAELASLRFLSRPEVAGQADLGAPGLVGDSRGSGSWSWRTSGTASAWPTSCSPRCRRGARGR